MQDPGGPVSTPLAPLDPRPDLALLEAQVTPDNVLAAAAILIEEADRLDALLLRVGPQASVGECGGDPVSKDASRAFNERIDRIFEACWRYNEELRAGGLRMHDTARSYGFTEEQIAASFRSS